MIIATFNVNSLRTRLGIILDWFGANQPDVLCVQETKVQDHDFPVEAFAQSGYEFVFRGQKKYNGVAIFSKSPISDVSFGLADEPKDEARLIKAVINGITIVNTYIPQGYDRESEKFQYKLRWFARLAEYFKRHFKPNDSIVWAGDFNIAREPKDVYDPEGLWGHVCYCSEVQNALNKIMEWGFVDVFRRHCNQAAQYTFWDHRGGAFRQNMGWRLDYIMATKTLAAKCTNCWIDKKPRSADKPSDHTPLIAQFKV